MKKRFSVAAVLVLCLVTATITYVFTSNSAKSYYNAQLDQAYSDLAPFSKLLEIHSYVTEHYVGEIDEEKLLNGVYNGYFQGLGDRFSMYHTKEEMDEMNMTSDGKLVGIGIVVSYDLDEQSIYVRRIMPDSPAEKAGLQIGDRITAVDGIKLSEETYVECVDAVKGEEGTSLSIEVKRGSETLKLDLVRASVRSKVVYLDYLEGNIAYITISEFSGNAASDFINCMREAEAKKVSGYIFDMRSNPGGDLEIICTILDYLLPEGPIIRVKYASGDICFTRDSGKSCVDAPMTVLVNGNTASAAELFTAALRDYHKATIIGTTTFGKGTMQRIVTLSDGTGVRLSWYYYDPPYGENYHDKGITPDIILAQDEYYELRPYLLNETNDIQIKAAKDELAKIMKEKNK